MELPDMHVHIHVHHKGGKKALRKIRARVANLETGFEEMKVTVAEVKAKFTELRTTIDERQATLSTNFAALRAKIEEQGNSDTELEDLLTNMQDAIDDVKSPIPGEEDIIDPPIDNANGGN